MAREAYPTWRRVRDGRQSVEKLLARERVVDGIRRFFKSRGFNEIETPLLVAHPGMEPHLEVFETELRTAGGRRAGHYLGAGVPSRPARRGGAAPRSRAADDPVRLPDPARGASAREAGGPALRRAVRAVRGRSGARECLLGAHRPGRTAGQARGR